MLASVYVALILMASCHQVQAELANSYITGEVFERTNLTNRVYNRWGTGQTSTTKTSPSPKTSPPPSGKATAYKGTYLISPINVCSNTFITFVRSNCSDIAVNLSTYSQVKADPRRRNWYLDTSGKPRPIIASRPCSAGCLAASPKPSNLVVSGTGWKWQIVPIIGSANTNKVNLISQNRPSTASFLGVNPSCKSFKWAAKPGKTEQFLLKKVSIDSL